MAIDMCSESSPLIISPRISFSHDLCHMDDIEPTEESSQMESNPDQFDFSFSDGIGNEISTADELFSDGQILPLELQEKFVTPKNISFPPLPLPSQNECPKPENSSKEIVCTSVIETEQKHHSKSFWRIDKSRSVHCDNSYKKSSFWSLPLMSRSNSTGSVPSPRQILKENKKQNSQKQLKNSSPSNSSGFYMYQLSQKPPLKKNYGGSYGNGVRVNPMLNVNPPPYIAKGTANLFGLGSLFRDKKDKKNKK